MAFVGKCFCCGRLFQASEPQNVGQLTINGSTYRVELCNNHIEVLERETRYARRTLGLDTPPRHAG